MERVVLHDPARELREGTILDKPRAIIAATNRRVITLPIDSDLMGDPLGGYFKRAWGRGWLFTRMAGERGCPMMLHVATGRPNIHWCARLQQVEGEEPPSGQLKLTTDSSKQRGMSGGLGVELRAKPLDQLGPPDAEGGWTVGGRCSLNIAMTGNLSLTLYAVARRALVVWSAVSQSVKAGDVAGSME